MIDHIHILASAENLLQISGFVSAFSSIYVREFNSSCNREGPIFERKYGSAIKLEIKKIRSAIAYLFNNPVEKQLCTDAEGYRWNFLKYYDPDKTTSITKRKSLSRSLQRALKIIDSTFRNHTYLKHVLLANIAGTLSNNEKELLTDYIITLYFPFKMEMPQKFFKSYKEMVIAVNSNTGSEYDIDEKHYCKTDVPYREIIHYLKREGIKNIKEIITESTEVKKDYFKHIRKNTSATSLQIRKFLHYNPEYNPKP